MNENVMLWKEHRRIPLTRKIQSCLCDLWQYNQHTSSEMGSVNLIHSQYGIDLAKKQSTVPSYHRSSEWGLGWGGRVGASMDTTALFRVGLLKVKTKSWWPPNTYFRYVSDGASTCIFFAKLGLTFAYLCINPASMLIS